MADMPLPQAAIAALQRGDKLAAIRMVREATGLDLKQAALAVEAHGRRHLAASAGRDATAGPLGGPQVAQRILDSLVAGKKIDAMQLLREHGGSDLKGALQTVEALFGQRRSDAVAQHEHRAEHRLDAERARESVRLQALIHEKRVPTVSPGDAPGAGLLWVLVALGAVLIWLALAAFGA